MVRIASEIATKSRRVRRRFQDRLARNIRDALASSGIEATVDARWSRLLVRAEDAAAAQRVAEVFGVSSVSPIEARLPAVLDDIVRVGEALFSDHVRGRRFAVSARRAGALPFETQELRVRLGAALHRVAAGVDLDHPEVTIYVELRDGEAFLYRERLPGVGGLPVGVEGRAVCLLSGGFDSPVAAWMMLKRGVALDYVLCNLGGDAYERAVVSVAKVLADAWSFGDRPRMHVVPFGGVVDALRQRVTPRYWQVVLKRLMYRVGERIAVEGGADALVTGEAVGQVSSQTLGNLRAIDDAVTLPVFRPVIGLDKEEIIRRAQRIGTAPLSAHVREYCAILPDRPVTRARVEAIRNEEAKLDLAVLDAAVAARRVLDLRALRPVDLVAPYLFTSEVPAGAAVIDCREEHHYRVWHYPGAIRCDVSELLADLSRWDKDRRYVLYCGFGVLSAYAAEVMQRAGYEAYSFKGGASELRRLVREREAAVGV